jgi:hypothetical protein
MALTNTTLAAALDASAITFKATAATGATVGAPVLIDHEFMVVTAITSTTITVRSRGDNGTAAVAHVALCPVTFSAAASDFPALQPNSGAPYAPLIRDFITIGADGAIPVPVRDTIVLVTKATAAALTLAAPSAGSDGTVLTIVGGTAAAHTVTYTAGFYGDTTSSDVATFAAKAGASMQAIAYQGAWAALSLANVTLG